MTLKAYYSGTVGELRNMSLTQFIATVQWNAQLRNGIKVRKLKIKSV